MSRLLRHLLIVFRKEALDGVRDRRSLLSALIFPLLGPLLLAVTFTQVVEEQTDAGPVTLPVAGGELAPGLIETLARDEIEIVDAPEDPIAAVEAGEADFVLVVDPGYGEAFRAGRPAKLELVVDSSRRELRPHVERVRTRIELYGATVGNLRLLARGVHPEIVRPVNVVRVDTATPQQRAANLLSMAPMFVLMAAFIGGMFVATDSTAGERERKSLEPLLLNPVSRWALAIGKWLATAFFSGICVGITFVCTAVALEQVPLHELGLSLKVETTQLIVGALALVPVAMVAASAQLIVATFARSFREAQTYLSLLTLLPMVPGIIFLLKPSAAKSWMSFIPILGQQALLTELLSGEPLPMAGVLIGAAVSLVLAIAGVWGVARMFSRERIIV